MARDLPVIRDLTRSAHYRRYMRNRNGETFEEIAKSEGVSEKTVRVSCKNVEVYNMMTAAEHVNHGLGSILINAVPLASEALNAALCATDEIEVTDEKGAKSKKLVPDHSTRTRAIESFTEIAKTIQPKAPGPSTHVQVGVGVGANDGIKATGTFVNMEARMREIRSIQAMPQLEGSVQQGVVEGVVEEVAHAAD